MCMRRVGFTTIELIIVVVMIGIIAVIGFPKIRRALDTTNVRSAPLTRMIAQRQRSAVADNHGAPILDSLRAVACTVRNPGSAVVWRGGTPVDALSWRYTADTTNHWRLVLSSKYRTRQSQWRRDSMETYISCLL